MRRYVIGFLATIGFLVILFVCVGIGLGFWFWNRPHGPEVATNTVLTLDLTVAPPDEPDGRGVSQLLFPSGLTLADTLEALHHASNDPHITGLVARIGDSGMGFAEVQELRDAIAAFRAKGKRAVAYTDTFGELSSGMRSYYLASAFNQIWLQPMGTVGLVGLSAGMPYFRGTLDRLGIVPDFERREQYKDAANPLIDTAMTGPEREEIQALLQSVYGQIVQGIAVDRKLTPDAVRALINQAPLLGQAALKAHLVDHIGGRAGAISSFGATPRLVSLGDYLDQVGPLDHNGPTIALIYATGLMTRGGGGTNPLSGDGVMNADDIVRAFRLAAASKSVRAILFRINSPGGSAIAAETIWEAVERARNAGKPVIVSMGDVAGSGGYYIAAPANKIVAEPATLTGSIGVIAGKVVLNGLLKKLGGNWDTVEIGQNANMFSAMQGFSPSEHARLTAVIDNIYDGFKQRVAEGRKLSATQVEAVAKGRVWSGEDAKAHGLVDVLGGFDTALDLAKKAAGIAANEDVTLKLYPPPERGIRAIIASLLSGGADDLLAPRLLGALKVETERLNMMLAPPGALVMPPIVLR